MASLIITIISIGLVAVAALMGAYYGGTALLNNTAQVHANTLLNETRQIFAAATEYSLNHGFSNFGGDFSLYDVYNTPGYTSGPLPIAGVPTPVLTDANGGDQQNSSVSGTFDGESVFLSRAIYQNNGKNVVGMLMADMTGGSWSGGAIAAWGADLSLAASAKLPLVKMALAINKTMGLPTGLTFAPSGLPYALDGSFVFTGMTAPGITGYMPGAFFNGSDKFNYCYLAGTSGSAQQMICVFTS